MKAINSIIYMMLAGVIAIVTACNETAVVHPDLFLEEEHLYFEVSEYGAADTLGNGAIITFPKEGDSKYLYVETNCSSSSSELPDWIGKTKIQEFETSEIKGYRIELTAEANNASSARECELNFEINGLFNRKLHIVQAGSAPYLVVNFENGAKLYFSAGAQMETYAVSTNISLSDIVVENNNDWISVGFVDGKLSVSVQENVSTESRTSTLVSMKYSSETLLSFIVQQDGYSATGDGTEANPYNIAKALSLARALDSSGKITGVYVKGRIADVQEVETTTYGNATYHLEDVEGGERFFVYRGYWLNGIKFTSNEQLKVGVEVVVYGDMINYLGLYPQMPARSYIVTYDGKRGEENPYMNIDFENEARIDFTSESQTKTYSITTNVSLNDVVIENDNDWVTVGFTDGKLSVSVQDNVSTDSRTSLSISLKYSSKTILSFTVLQEGANAYFRTEFDNGITLNFDPNFQEEVYWVVTNVSMEDVVIENNNDWVTVSFVNGKLSLSLQENTTAYNRTSFPITFKYSTEILFSFIVQQEAYLGDGTFENPYNVAKALKLINDMGFTGSISGVYVRGTISTIMRVGEYAIFWIRDLKGSPRLYINKAYWLNGEKFSSKDQIEDGADVVIYGDLVINTGHEPEMSAGAYIASYNGNIGVTVKPNSQVISMLSQELTRIPSDWTIDDVFLSSEISYVWSWHMYNEAGYLNASAYMNGTPHTATAYAISPEIDLTNATEASFSFEHAAKFQTTLRTLCGLVVREVGTTVWNDLTIPVWPEADLWAFVNSGEISLERYLGKRIQIAFKYGSSSDGADTWQIRNLVIKTVSNGMGLGGYGDDQDITIKANKR